MEIVKNWTKNVEFGSLGAGEVFMDTSGNVMMKMITFGSGCENANYVFLENGGSGYRNVTDKVIPVKAKVIVE